MNRFCVVFCLALASTSFAEPPRSTYGLPSISSEYGVPEVSSGYNYKPQIVSTDYIQKDPGHIPTEGYNLDPHLLNKVRDILIDHENSGSSRIISKPSFSYGVPQSTYGPPSHWVQSSRVVGLDFGHLTQSIPVAYYVGTDRYASAHASSGWNVASSGWNAGNSGYASGNSGWSSGNSGWSSGNSGWSKPTIVLKPAPPSISYGVPRW